MNEPEIDPTDIPFFWEEEPGEDLALLTMLASESVMRRIWDTPEEDAAWKYLEDREHGTV